MSESELETEYSNYLKSIPSQGLEGPIPQVRRVRWIYPEESGPVWAKCLGDAGFDAKPTSDGRGLQVNYGNDSQRSAYLRANYICRASYPIDPRLMRHTWTPERKRAAYEYLTGWLIPCLRANGVTPDEPPTLAVFESDPVVAWGYPDLGSEQAMDDMLTKCPADPPSGAILGDT